MTTKKKMKLSDCKPATIKVDLVHPELGQLDGWVKVKSARCNEYISAVTDLDREENSKEDDSKRTFEEALLESGKLATVLIEDWDEEFFECPFTQENALKIFSNSQNTWIRDLINSKQKDQSNFFTKS